MSLFSNNKTKSLFAPWKPGSIKKSKYGFGACTDTSVLILIPVNVLLRHDFICSSSFALSWVDKVTTET